MMTENILTQLEEKLKKGETKEVLSYLYEMNQSQILRKDRLDFAELARRAGAPELAIRFLIHIIYPKIKPSAGDEATADESVSYASSLRALGFLKEAQDILNKFDPERHPIVLLQKALLLFSEWRYPESIRFLKKFVRSKKISDYQKTVGQVNLFSAYVSSEDYLSANKLADELLKVTKNKNYLLLYGNCLELMAQYCIFTEQYVLAESYLDQAETVLKDFSGIYLLYVKKWKLILQLLTRQKATDFDLQFQYLIENSQNKNYSEIVRDLLFFRALADQDDQKTLQVLAGTPITSYHRRASLLLKKKFFIPSQITFQQERASDGLFDYKSHHFLNKSLLRKLLWLLSQDFYKPTSVGQIFSVIYPSECFNPETSVKRVDNLIFRLNCYFKKNNISILIKRRHYSYKIIGLDQMIIYRDLISNQELALKLFKKKYLLKQFKRIDLEQILDISSAAAKRLLHYALQVKKVRRLNTGPKSRYTFSNFRA